MNQPEPGAGGASPGEERSLPIPQDLLDLLVCPLGKAPLRLEGAALVCTRCGLRYGIEDGIPNMLIEDAKLPAGASDIKELACYPQS